jgi:magnesium transporter
MLTKLYLSGEKVKIAPVKSAKDFHAKPYVWIRAVTPNDEEMALLAQVLSLDDLGLEDLKSFLEFGDRSRLEKDDFLQIVYAVPTIVDNEVDTEDIMIFAKRDVVVTIERERLAICNNYQNRAEKNKGKYLFAQNAGFFISEFLDEAGTRFLKHVNKIESRIDVLSSLDKPLTKEQIDAVASANYTLSIFNRSSLANLEVLSSLKKTYHESLVSENREAFADMYFDALQVVDAQKVQREMIMNLFNIQSIISGNQMNKYMKKLTAFAFIIMVPTLVSSIYGMNVRGLPFAEHEYGFWFVFISLTIITVSLYAWFKKNDWL